MKLVFFFLILGLNLFSQQSNEKIIGKWYYCGSVCEPNKTENLKFSSDKNCCDDFLETFYWEFADNGNYIWSDIQVDETDKVIDGVIVVPINDKWKIEKNVIIMGPNSFKIVRLNKKKLILRKIE